MASATRLAALRAQLPVRSQNDAFFRLQAGWAGFLGISGLAAVDLQDQSAFYQASSTLTIHDNLDLTLTGQATSGEAGDSWEFVNPASSDRYLMAFSTTYHF